jgi:hypothetical protein
MPRTQVERSPRIRTPRIRRALALLVLAALASSCESVAGTDQYGKVAVDVHADDGEPLPGLALTLYTGTRPIAYADTDMNGEYVFERVPPLPQGYGVTLGIPPAFLDPGEVDRFTQQRLDVRAGTVTPVHVVLPRCTGTLRATVRDELARPVARHGVRFYGIEIATVDTVTGADGTITLPRRPCGVHGIQVIPTPGYVLPAKAAQDNIALRRGGFFAADFTVRRSAPPAP